MIVSKYWIGSHESIAEKVGLEAEIKVQKMILLGELRSLTRKYSAVRKIRETNQKQIRDEFIGHATGGSFESAQWKPDPKRAHALTRTVTKIIASLPYNL